MRARLKRRFLEGAILQSSASAARGPLQRRAQRVFSWRANRTRITCGNRSPFLAEGCPLQRLPLWLLETRARGGGGRQARARRGDQTDLTKFLPAVNLRGQTCVLVLVLCLPKDFTAAPQRRQHRAQPERPSRREALEVQPAA